MDSMNDELYGLFTRVMSGAMSLEHALQVARSLPERCDFTDAGVHPLVRSAIGAARAGNAQAACILWRLVLEALDHSRTPAQAEAARSAASAWLNIATNLLFQSADGRVLADARRRGEQLAESLLAEGAAGASGVLFGLGAMHLDPYIERRDVKNFAAQVDVWRRGGRDTAIDLALPGEIEMPPADTALSDAAAFLERSAALRQGRERGKSLKALAEALFWHGTATGSFDHARIAAAIREARQLLDPAEDATALAQLQQYLRVLGDPADAAPPAPGPEVRQSEPDPATDPRGFIHALALRAQSALTPAHAIADLRRALRSAGDIGDEQARIQLTAMLAERASEAFAIDDLVAGAARDWTAAREALRLQAAGASWTPDDAALASLALAMATSADDREDAGLAVIAEALTADGSRAAEIDLALTTARAQLAWFLGTNAMKAGQMPAAFCRYLDAVRVSIAADMPELARENFRRAQDAFARVEHPGSAAVIESMAAALPALQAERGGAEGKDILELWRQTVRDAVFVTGTVADVDLALQAAKGASLVLARAGHLERPVFTVPGVQRALQNWRAQHARTRPSSVSRTEIDQERLLSAYADNPRAGGATPQEQLDNVARALDRQLIAALAHGVRTAGAAVLEASEIQARLPEKTALVSFFLCPTERWTVGVVVLLATRQGITVRRIESDEPMSRAFGVDGVYTDDLSPLVASLRRKLTSGPGAGTLDADAQRMLGSLYSYCFGAVDQDLQELRKKEFSHLCVNPYGAFHFCPMGLLGKDGRPLADDWLVTHLPSVGMLRWQGASTPSASDREGTAVFGLSFANRLHGLAALPGAVDEARMVAEVVQGELLLDDRATASAFNHALTARRAVHLATHGSQDAAAPAVQTLFLHPETDHDGEYRAFEVLQQPLDGLDLVTLSACETALGRIDVNDNPRGLQAFLFAGGAATIVSCLWPVADDVAARFFGTFYLEIAGGSAKLAAFAEAQRAVRSLYPAYQEWGTFQYSGLW